MHFPSGQEKRLQHINRRNALNKFLADRKIFIGINAAFFPDNIKVMLHFKVCQGDFSYIILPY